MPIDLSWDALPPGVHDGVITEVDFKFGSTVSIVIAYRAPHGGADYFVSEWLTLEAPRAVAGLLQSSPHSSSCLGALTASAFPVGVRSQTRACVRLS